MAPKASVIVANVDRCNIKGIKGFTSEALKIVILIIRFYNTVPEREE